MPRYARTGVFTDAPFYECKHDWPVDCFVQGGDAGIVFARDGSYRTSFFEAFPKDPETFIRGEGATIEEAEEKAWKALHKYRACLSHEFESRGYENGAGFCKHCGMFASGVIAPVHKCHKCETPTWHHKDNRGDFWCEGCVGDMPEDRLSEMDKKVREMMREMREWEQENKL